MTTAFIPLNCQQFNILQILQQKHRQLHSFLKEIDTVVEVQQQQHTSSDVRSATSFLLQQQGRREMIGRAMIRSASYTVSSLLLIKQQPCYASSDDAIIATSTSSKSSTAMNNNFILAQPPDSVNFPTGLLESRVLENVYSYPQYGMESIDIFYPTWFYGTWNVASTTTSIEAPLGRSVFGSNATYQSALAEIGTTLHYESRFIDVGASRRPGDDGTTTTTTTTIIADRGYNVQSIATAALGRNSVVDIPFVSANKLTAILSPIGAPNPLRVDLFTVNRRQEYVDDTHFHCSEVVREIVSSVGNKDGNANSRSSASSMSTILKEVETTTLYTLNIDPKDPNKVTIRGRQRSAKFLVPTQNDATSFRLYEMTRGKPVDVRFYDVVYTKKSNV